MSQHKNSTEKAGGRAAWLKLVFLGLCVTLLAFLVRSYFYNPSVLRELWATLQSIRDHWWAGPAFLIAYLIGTTGLVPAVIFHMICGAVFGFPKALLLNLIAVNLAANLQFLWARKLGRATVARLLERFGLGRLEPLAHTHGLKAVVLLRQLPLPFVGVNAAAGVSSMRAADFALGSGLGSLPVTVVYTYLAASLLEGVAGAKERAFVQSAIAAALAFAATFVPRWWARWREARRAGLPPQP